MERKEETISPVDLKRREVLELAGEKPVALVTGATGGIGNAICAVLGRSGYLVIAGCRNREKGTALVERLSSKGYAAQPLVCDVSHPDAVAGAFRELEGLTDRLDLVVNNAGFNRAMPFEQTTPDQWQDLLSVNLLGPLAVCWHAIPWLRRTRGTIVNVTSESGFAGTAGEVPYSAAKAGLTAVTKALARELARDGIRVNAVSPGPIQTGMLEDLTGGDLEASRVRVDKMVRAIPMRRLGRPEEIADAVAFLASDRSSFVTGQTIHVAGGVLMC
ncbi:MAG: SDR family oxidoreductase [Thermoleophilia bacterium]|nr:SDR family oxidoreductase [Thermoleophilia bacterium]